MEQTGTATGEGTKRRGRKDKDGSEEVIKFGPIKEAADDVMKLMRRAASARTDANDALKALAERSGTNTRNLKALFNASLKGNFADVRRDIDQQQVLFETVGEIAGGSESEK